MGELRENGCMAARRVSNKKKVGRWTRERLIRLGIPAVLIPGIILAIILGWNPVKLAEVRDYHEIKQVFPESGVVKEVSDGDTFELKNGVGVRMIGINAPDRGDERFDASRNQLVQLIDGKRVYLEYDRYQDDKYGRILAWVWTGCETTPKFLSSDYMHLTYNTSRQGLMDNPQGCYEGTLVNEEMVQKGLATAVRYKERGELRYEGRLTGRSLLLKTWI